MQGTGDQALKEQTRAKLAADVAEFVGRGGTIEQIELPSQTGDKVREQGRP